MDYRRRVELLARIDDGWLPPVDDDEGAAKLLVTSRALRLRRDRPDLFTGYAPVAVDGAAADHVFAFDRGGALDRGDPAAGRSGRGRRLAGHGAATCRRATGRDELTGRPAVVGTCPSANLLDTYPVALLVRNT